MTSESRDTPTPQLLPAGPVRAALLGLLTLSACAPRETSPLAEARAHPEQMRALVASAIAAQYDPALATLRRAAMAAPSNLALQARYAGALARAGEPAAAEAVVTAGLAQSPEHPGLLVELARIRVRGGQAEVALALFDRAARLEPGADAEEGRGIALDLLGRHHEAQAAYRAALTLSPERVSVQNNLAMSLLLTGQVGEALALLEPLAQRRDAPARVNNNLAIARTMLGGAPRQDIAADPQVREVASNLRATIGAAPAQPAPQGLFAAGEPGRGASVPLLPLDTPARASWAVASAPAPALAAPADLPEVATPVALPAVQLPARTAVAREPLQVVLPAPLAPALPPEIAASVTLPGAHPPAIARDPRPAHLPAAMAAPTGLPPEIVTQVALPIERPQPRVTIQREVLPALSSVPAPRTEVAAPVTPALLPLDGLPARAVIRREALPAVLHVLTPAALPPEAGASVASTPRTSQAQRRRSMATPHLATAGLPPGLAPSLPPEQGVPDPAVLAGFNPPPRAALPRRELLPAATPVSLPTATAPHAPAPIRPAAMARPSAPANSGVDEGVVTQIAVAATAPTQPLAPVPVVLETREVETSQPDAPVHAALTLPAADAPIAVEPPRIAAVGGSPPALGAPQPELRMAATPRLGFSVQIAALSSEHAARSYWSSLLQHLPTALGDRAPEIVRADLPHGTFWRLRTGSFPTATDARGFCQALRAHGRGCWVPGG